MAVNFLFIVLLPVLAFPRTGARVDRWIEEVIFQKNNLRGVIQIIQLESCSL